MRSGAARRVGLWDNSGSAILCVVLAACDIEILESGSIADRRRALSDMFAKCVSRVRRCNSSETIAEDVPARDGGHA
jgi:hypothetical protein